VAVLVTRLGLEARRDQLVGGCCLEGPELPGNGRLSDAKARDQSGHLVFSLWPSVGHAALSAAKSMAA